MSIISDQHYQQWLATLKQQNEFVQQAVGQLPWGHNVALMSKCKELLSCFSSAVLNFPSNNSSAALLVDLEDKLLSIEKIEPELLSDFGGSEDE